MDSEARRRVEEKVREILGAADLDTVTEEKVRGLAAASLGVDLSDIESKKLVRGVVEAFLLSTCDDDDRARVCGGGIDGKENDNSNLGGEVKARANGEESGAEPPESSENCNDDDRARVCGGGLHGKENANSNLGEEGKPRVNGGESGANPSGSTEHCNGGQAPVNGTGDGGIRFVCKLSNKRSVAIKDSAKDKVVLIGEFLWKDGNRVPGSRGISLTGEQWLTFRNSFPAIEDAIRKVKSSLRSEIEDKSEPRPSNADIRNGPEFKKPKFMPAKQKLDIYPIQIVRFDGKNYHEWARQVELFLKQLNLGYVLSDPCPSAVGVSNREIPQILAAAKKWMDDDCLCRTSILSSLSDHLFDSFSKKPGSAKELWDELKLVYLAEEYGSKTSLVKKYMEFQMTEEKSAVEQAQELNELADSLVPYGIHVEESFHVNAIISKLPSSWKNVAVKLMMENNLPVWMLMNCLKQEEELRKSGKRGASPAIAAHDAEPPRGRRGWQPACSNRPGIVQSKHAPERERKVLFCTICKRKGHLEEKCWFKNSKDDRVSSSTAVSEPGERALK